MKLFTKMSLSLLAIMLVISTSTNVQARVDSATWTEDLLETPYINSETTVRKEIPGTITLETRAPIKDVKIPSPIYGNEKFNVIIEGYLPSGAHYLTGFDVEYVAESIREKYKHNQIINVIPKMAKKNEMGISVIRPYSKKVQIEGQPTGTIIINVVGSNQTITEKIKVVDIIGIPIPETVTLRGLFKEQSNKDEYPYKLVNMNGKKLVLLKKSSDTNIDYDYFVDKGVKITGKIFNDNDDDDSVAIPSIPCRNDDSVAIPTMPYGDDGLMETPYVDNDSVAIPSIPCEDDTPKATHSGQNIIKPLLKVRNGTSVSKSAISVENITPINIIESLSIEYKVLEILSIDIIKAGDTYSNKPIDELAVEIIPFIDIPIDNWAKEYIEYLKNNNIVSGFSDGTFKPENHITKSEVAKIVTSITGNSYDDISILESILPEEMPVFDLSDWQKKVAVLSEEMGVVDSIEELIGSANEQATRGEIVEMILRVANVDVNNITVSSFDDVSTDNEHWKYIEKAKELNIVNGYEDGSFKPNAPVQRDQMAKIIKNTIETL